MRNNSKDATVQIVKDMPLIPDLTRALKICTSSGNGCAQAGTCSDCYLNGQPLCQAVLHTDVIDKLNFLADEVDRLMKLSFERHKRIHYLNMELEELKKTNYINVRNKAFKDFYNGCQVHKYLIDSPKEHYVIDEDDLDSVFRKLHTPEDSTPDTTTTSVSEEQFLTDLNTTLQKYFNYVPLDYVLKIGKRLYELGYVHFTED